MSIIVSGLSYRHPDKSSLFENVSLSVADGCKTSVVADNGKGKSMLLRIVAGELEPSAGSVSCSSEPYYIPQNIGATGKTAAEALRIADKLRAMESIARGDVSEELFELVADDWEIERRARQALEEWGLGGVALDTPVDLLSGGERTKLYLAGIALHDPQTILLDEPTNHLDYAGRERLYDLVRRSTATLLVVSHDIRLLDMLDLTCELTPRGIRPYGGNYTFYRTLKEAEENALDESIAAGEKTLRLARRKAQEARERQQRRESAGRREAGRGGQPRILANAKAGKGQETGARLQDVHSRKMEQSGQRLGELRSRRERTASLRLDFDDAVLHEGKLLIEAVGVNHEYSPGKPLWSEPLDITVYSGDRIHIRGGNGSGKTTLAKILAGGMEPTAGVVRRAEFGYVCLDQDCATMNSQMSVAEMAESFNRGNLEPHAVKTRLDRALFPQDTWNKSCSSLSGGERMRLYLCCLMISNHVPDMFILDEPTNNLDISSAGILIDTIADFRGTLLVISHDSHFTERAWITHEIWLSGRDGL